jgi:hypothetical protein
MMTSSKGRAASDVKMPPALESRQRIDLQTVIEPVD